MLKKCLYKNMAFTIHKKYLPKKRRERKKSTERRRKKIQNKKKYWRKKKHCGKKEVSIGCLRNGKNANICVPYTQVDNSAMVLETLASQIRRRTISRSGEQFRRADGYINYQPPAPRLPFISEELYRFCSGYRPSTGVALNKRPRAVP